LRDGVVTVFGDEGHGSGFLINEQGLILTNQHVIENSTHIRVQFNEKVKVSAKLVAEDEKKDLAILLVNESVINDVPILKIAPQRDELAFAGEKVIAIGSPLNQTRILTSGIVSKVEEGAIISDVNINAGNSGGPLINMDREVIAINTFADVQMRGPGISGSIPITIAYDIIGRAGSKCRHMSQPSSELLPVRPKDIYPLWALECAVSDSQRKGKLKKMAKIGGDKNGKSYQISQVSDTDDFVVNIVTPPYIYKQEKLHELEVTQKRRKRESKGGATEDERYDPFDDLKEWYQYGGQYSPTVELYVTPKVGETAGSMWGNVLLATISGAAGVPYYYGHHTYEFKDDLKDCRLSVNGKPQCEIQRGMRYIPMDQKSSTHTAQDMARAGIFIFPYHIFEPVGGKWPIITIELISVDEPNKPTRFTLPRKTMEQIWYDFQPYRDQVKARNVSLNISE
jgi:hypothetical protein